MTGRISVFRWLGVIALGAVAGQAIAAASADVSLPPANTIGGVWDLGSQPCNGSFANAYTRRADQALVRESKRVELPKLGYAIRVLQVPEVQTTVVKIKLDDRTRGVVDHYFLMADQDLEPPFAAIVITELPEEVIRDHKAFEAVRMLQSQLARKAGLQPALEEIQGPHGAGLEMLIRDRVGTDCFPTSDFQLLPPSARVHSIGISRFVVIDERLVEFTAVIALEEDEKMEQAEQRARAFMDGFWLALEKLPKKS
jgi:hypothetical protein